MRGSRAWEPGVGQSPTLIRPEPAGSAWATQANSLPAGLRNPPRPPRRALDAGAVGGDAVFPYHLTIKASSTARTSAATRTTVKQRERCQMFDQRSGAHAACVPRRMSSGDIRGWGVKTFSEGLQGSASDASAAVRRSASCLTPSPAPTAQSPSYRKRRERQELRERDVGPLGDGPRGVECAGAILGSCRR